MFLNNLKNNELEWTPKFGTQLRIAEVISVCINFIIQYKLKLS